MSHAVFADFCHLHRADIERLVATRATQTNEVGRCSALLPGLCLIASQYGWHEPLSLLDLGTSAGLNLLFDDYAYTYRSAEGAAVRTAGASDSACRSGMLRAGRRDVACPSSACLSWPSGSDSISHPSTRSPTTKPAGCWPASGPTTRRASGACALRWPTCEPRHILRAWSEATC